MRACGACCMTCLQISVQGCGPFHACAPVHAVSESGDIPPGNEKGNATWSLRRAPPKPEIKLTPGKGVQDLTCSVEDLVDKIVKSNKVASRAAISASHTT